MYLVLMAGGVGTRFWPRSRRSNPKQLLNIIDSRSMLQLTFDRIKGLTSPDRILIITNHVQKPLIINQLPEIPADNIIAEPVGKNTAPCIGLAASVIKAKQKENEIMVVLPADHLVGNTDEFQKTINAGVEYIKENKCLLTIGITPTYPETGYGYIQSDKKIQEYSGKEIFKVKTFAEKPNLDTAKRFLKSGDFYWNSGMFVWSVNDILAEIDEHLPELSADLKKIERSYCSDKFTHVVSDVYSRTKSVSIDYGVMENSKHVCVIKADFNWNDLGSWNALYNISPKDNKGNVVTAKKSVVINSKNNYFYSTKKLIAAVDVENLVVVDMDDAILVCTKENSQNIKAVVDYLERKDMDEYL